MADEELSENLEVSSQSNRFADVSLLSPETSVIPQIEQLASTASVTVENSPIQQLQQNSHNNQFELNRNTATTNVLNVHHHYHDQQNLLSPSHNVEDLTRTNQPTPSHEDIFNRFKEIANSSLDDKISTFPDAFGNTRDITDEMSHNTPIAEETEFGILKHESRSHPGEQPQSFTNIHDAMT